MFLKILKLSQGNNCSGVSFNKVAGQLSLKETLAEMFFREICETFKNTFFDSTLPVTASKPRLAFALGKCFPLWSLSFYNNFISLFL